MEKHGKTQVDLAGECGCSYQTVQKWLKGAWPAGNYVVPLSRALETDATYLLTGEDETTGFPASRADAVQVAKAEVARLVKVALDQVLSEIELSDEANRPGREGPRRVRGSKDAKPHP